MINIQEVNIPTKGIANKIRFNVHPFGLSPTNGFRIGYVLTDDNNKYVVGGIINVPQEIYDNWGTDDSYIVNYCLNELKLTAV